MSEAWRSRARRATCRWSDRSPTYPLARRASRSSTGVRRRTRRSWERSTRRARCGRLRARRDGAGRAPSLLGRQRRRRKFDREWSLLRAGGGGREARDCPRDSSSLRRMPPRGQGRSARAVGQGGSTRVETVASRWRSRAVQSPTHLDRLVEPHHRRKA